MIEGAGFHGAVFDVDGVLVDSPHEHAWRVALDQLFETRWTSIRDATQYTSERFTPEVYGAHISGKPTMSGARAALSYFGVPATDARTEEYARRKQRVMDKLLRAGELTAYPDALRFVLPCVAPKPRSRRPRPRRTQLGYSARSDSMPSPIARVFARTSSGRASPCSTFSTRTSLEGISPGGKPHPEIFLTAARELGVPADRCFAVEDAVSGVQAAKAADMAVIGLARAGEADALAAADADVIVSTLDEVDLPALSEGCVARKKEPPDSFS